MTVYQNSQQPVDDNGNQHDQNKNWLSPGVKAQAGKQEEIVFESPPLEEGIEIPDKHEG
jgi:hypothetical protein